MSKPQTEEQGQSDEGAIVDESVSPEYAGTDLTRKPRGSKPAGETVRHQPAPQGSVADDVERGAVEEIEEQTDGTPTEGGPLVQPNRQDVQEG